MRLLLLLTILFLAAALGCAPGIKFYPIPELEKESLSPRDVPAKVTKESADSLKRKGYVQIGSISETEIIKTCWGLDCVSFACSNTLQKDLTKDIIEKAASYGGDLIVINEDNRLETRSTSKSGGRCLSGYTTNYTETQCSGGYGNVARVCSDVTRSKYVCTGWDIISGSECLVSSQGHVWRHDPELQKRVAEFERERKRLEAEAEREKKRVATEAAVLASKVDAKKEKYLALKKNFYADIVKTGNDSELEPVKVGGKYGFKDKTGKFVIEPQFTDIMFGFSEGLAAVSIGEKDEKKWGFIDKTGKRVIRPTYEYVTSFSEGLAAARIDKKYGYINKTNQFIIDPQFKNADDFRGGIAPVMVGKKWGYIDKKGKLIIEPQFETAAPFFEGIAAVSVDNKYGYINKKGEFVVKPQFDYVSVFRNGLAIVKKDKKEGIINTAGEILAMEP